jgi:hypothetical protein
MNRENRTMSGCTQLFLPEILFLHFSAGMQHFKE